MHKRRESSKADCHPNLAIIDTSDLSSFDKCLRYLPDENPLAMIARSHPYGQLTPASKGDSLLFTIDELSVANAHDPQHLATHKNAAYV